MCASIGTVGGTFDPWFEPPYVTLPDHSLTLLGPKRQGRRSLDIGSQGDLACSYYRQDLLPAVEMAVSRS